MTPKTQHTRWIKEEAQRLGFDYCGISEAVKLEEDAPRLEQWLKQGRHGQMHYMEHHFEKRLDPRLLVPGARSVVSFLYNYYLPSPPQAGGSISRYASGEDYHDVLRSKLKALAAAMHDKIGDISGRVFVDSAPVLERRWAQRSGLGWMGKNANLINKQGGSFFFLAEWITELELDYDGPVKDYCGTCTRCLDACPTQAITAPGEVDGSRCIAYFTIELKEQLPASMKGSFQDWIFGCDICQEVCPWNRFSTPNREPRFAPLEAFDGMQMKDWMEMTESVFKKTFGSSPLSRTGLAGMKRNVKFAQE